MGAVPYRHSPVPSVVPRSAQRDWYWDEADDRLEIHGSTIYPSLAHASFIERQRRSDRCKRARAELGRPFLGTQEKSSGTNDAGGASLGAFGMLTPVAERTLSTRGDG